MAGEARAKERKVARRAIQAGPRASALTAGAANSSVRVHGEGALVAEIGWQGQDPQGGEGEGNQGAEREGEAGEAGGRRGQGTPEAGGEPQGQP